MRRVTGQRYLAIVIVFLTVLVAEGQTESSPQQTDGVTTIARMLWTWFSPFETQTEDVGESATDRSNSEEEAPAVNVPANGGASPVPTAAYDPAVARENIENFLGRECIACHGPNSPVVPQFDVTRFESLVRDNRLVPAQPGRSQILQQIQSGRMPPPQRPPLSEQDKRDLESWIVALQYRTVDPRPEKSIVDTLRDDLQLTKLVELGEKAGITEELDGGGPYTILAPTNEALERLNVSDDALWLFLLHHGIAGRQPSKKLETDGTAKSIGLQVLNIERQNGQLYIGGARVLQADVACKNGVIHVIDRLLWLPTGPGEGPGGIRWVPIPAGEFLRGSPPDAEYANDDEKPQILVRLSSFLLGETEVTRKQYQTIINEDPSYDKLARNVWPKDEPVQRVTWISAVEFCNKLSEIERLQPYYTVRTVHVNGVEKQVVTVPDPAGNGYRLPTEAEWEYACRAGSNGAYCFGNDPQQLNRYAVFREGSGSTLAPEQVGGKLSNAWGLFDMHGNVQEWCEDWYGPYPSLPAGARSLVNPKGPQTGTQKVYRGGSYLRTAEQCRSAVRSASSVLGTQDDFSHAGVGFRIARTLKGAQSDTPAVVPGGDR